MSLAIKVPHEQIKQFCQKHRIRKLSFFGSVLRDDFRPDSDVDVLVEFEPDARVGLIKLEGIELELSSLLGRRAEIHTVKGLHPYFKNNVLNEAEIHYEQP